MMITPYRIETRYYYVSRFFDELEKNLIFVNTNSHLENRAQFIKYLLHGVPTPAFYFDTNKQGIYVAVDGVKRLNALKDYFNNEFTISIDDDSDKFYFYKDLPVRVRRNLNSTILTFHFVDTFIPYDDKLYIFSHVQEMHKILSRINYDK